MLDIGCRSIFDSDQDMFREVKSTSPALPHPAPPITAPAPCYPGTQAWPRRRRGGCAG